MRGYGELLAIRTPRTPFQDRESVSHLPEIPTRI